MRMIRGLIIVAAILYTLLVPVILFVDKATSHNSRSSGGTVLFALCVGIYLYGSIFFLRERYSLSSLIISGAILNLMLACFWIPFCMSQELRFVGLIGGCLTFLWLTAILGKYRSERLK